MNPSPKDTGKPREFWATQIIGAEDGKYFMSEDEAFIEKLSVVETKFKVIDYSALQSRDEEIRKLKEDLSNCKSIIASLFAIMPAKLTANLRENINLVLTQTEGGKYE